MANEAAALPALVAELRDRIGSDGGFTIDMWTGLPVGHGVAVCADRAMGLRFELSSWDDGIVARWLGHCRSVAWSRPGLHLGGWHPAGGTEVHLDLVRVLPGDRRRLARALGVVRRQHAVFDLGRGAVVPIRAVG